MQTRQGSASTDKRRERLERRQRSPPASALMSPAWGGSKRPNTDVESNPRRRKSQRGAASPARSSASRRIIPPGCDGYGFAVADADTSFADRVAELLPQAAGFSFWMPDVTLARRLNYIDPTSMLNSNVDVGLKKMRDALPQSTARGSTGTTRWVGETSLYREQHNKQWMSYVAGGREVGLLTHGVKDQCALVDLCLSGSDARDVLVALLDGDIDAAVTQGDFDVLDDARKLILKGVRSKRVCCMLGWDRAEWLGRWEETGQDCWASAPGTRRGFMFELASCLSKFLKLIEQDVIKPAFAARFGYRLGATAPGLTASDLIERVQGALKQYRALYCDPEYLRSDASLLGRCDVGKWWTELDSSVKILLLGVGGQLSGKDLQLELDRVAEGHDDDDSDLSPAAEAAFLFAAEAMCVLVDGDKRDPRPPLMRMLNIIGDGEVISGDLVMLQNLLRQSSSAKQMRANRGTINLRHIEMMAQQVKRFMDDYSGDMINVSYDNEDTKGGASGFWGDSSDFHGTASEVQMNPGQDTEKLLFSSFTEARASVEQAEFELREQVEHGSKNVERWRDAKAYHSALMVDAAVEAKLMRCLGMEPLPNATRIMPQLIAAGDNPDGATIWVRVW